MEDWEKEFDDLYKNIINEHKNMSINYSNNIVKLNELVISEYSGSVILKEFISEQIKQAIIDYDRELGLKELFRFIDCLNPWRDENKLEKNRKQALEKRGIKE